MIISWIGKLRTRRSKSPFMPINGGRKWKRKPFDRHFWTIIRTIQENAPESAL